jgi:hypothetical protein
MGGWMDLPPSFTGGAPIDLFDSTADWDPLKTVDTAFIEPGFSLQAAAFSEAVPSDLIVPHLSDLPAGLSDIGGGGNGTTFAPAGASGPGFRGPGSGVADVTTTSTTSVPEPSGLFLLTTGLVGMATVLSLWRWRSRREAK